MPLDSLVRIKQIRKLSGIFSAFAMVILTFLSSLALSDFGGLAGLFLFFDFQTIVFVQGDHGRDLAADIHGGLFDPLVVYQRGQVQQLTGHNAPQNGQIIFITPPSFT